MTYRDYTGVATHQLVALWHKYGNKKDLVRVAEKAGIHPRDFRKIVISAQCTITGLKIVDRIVLAMGLNLATLVAMGEIDIIPTMDRNAPRKMAQDEFWVKGVTPTPTELSQRASELAEYRDNVLASLDKTRCV